MNLKTESFGSRFDISNLVNKKNIQSRHIQQIYFDSYLEKHVIVYWESKQ